MSGGPSGGGGSTCSGAGSAISLRSPSNLAPHPTNIFPPSGPPMKVWGTPLGPKANPPAVRVRRSSPTFGRWVGMALSADNRRIAWVPAGFGHGFLVVSEFAEVLYKATDYYAPEHERSIAWNDPDLAIGWPLAGTPVLSAKDAAGVRLRDAEVFP